MSNSIERRDFPTPEVRSLQQGHRMYPQAWEEVELRDYCRVMVKRKWLILAVSTSMLAAVAIQTFTMTPIYRSTASLQIDPEAANVLPYEDIMATPESYLSTEAYLQTQYKILESRALARRVIEKLNIADTQGLDVRTPATQSRRSSRRPAGGRPLRPAAGSSHRRSPRAPREGGSAGGRCAAPPRSA